MKKLYKAPECEIVEFAVDDSILNTVSGNSIFRAEGFCNDILVDSKNLEGWDLDVDNG